MCVVINVIVIITVTFMLYFDVILTVIQRSISKQCACVRVCVCVCVRTVGGHVYVTVEGKILFYQDCGSVR